MMKRQIKKTTVGLLALGMLSCMGTSAFADTEADYTKTENVYVRLAQDGNVEGTYVVNTFNVTKEGKITDYGDYSKVQNLTNLDAIETDKEEHTFRAEEGKFYYQGDMEEAELPWNFEITYELDGDEVEGAELEGAEGDLKLQIKVRKNPSFEDESFFNSYLLQTTITLDSSLCKNIHSEMTSVPQSEEEETVMSAGSMADAGGDTRVTFTVYPGSEANLTVYAEVEDFEMDDISIAGASMGAAAAAEEKETEQQYDENGNPIEPEIKSLSFVSEDNLDTDAVIFAISAPGVEIPDPVVRETEEEETDFIDKLKSLFE